MDIICSQYQLFDLAKGQDTTSKINAIGCRDIDHDGINLEDTPSKFLATAAVMEAKAIPKEEYELPEVFKANA
eukprot:scaffold47776_cov25-Prasinocladus_malaysianus.AAC.1